jgi:hypothetical protein
VSALASCALENEQPRHLTTMILAAAKTEAEENTGRWLRLLLALLVSIHRVWHIKPPGEYS